MACTRPRRRTRATVTHWYALLALMCVSSAAAAATRALRERRSDDNNLERAEDLLRSRRQTARRGSSSSDEAASVESEGRRRNLGSYERTNFAARPYQPTTAEGAPDGSSIVAVRLTLDSVGQSYGRNTKDNILAEQTAAIKRIQSTVPAGSVEIIGQTQLVLNAIYLRVTGDGDHHTVLSKITGDVSVKRVSPVGNYQIELESTVPYLGGKAVHNGYGFDGTDVTVAVLDTGVDYTHANLGGLGTVEAYQEAFGTNQLDPEDAGGARRDGLFPTAKVIEGYDFVGEISAGNTYDDYILHDDDPIDGGGHGTAVADIIAGVNGMAPGAKLVAVKVCSAGDGGCPGMSIALGLEYAVEQGVDIINLSLGSDYGQPFDDELTLAINSATQLGILTVASASNCGDRPYCTGTPAAARTALSVAQTTVPGRVLPVVTVNDVDYRAAWFPWSVTVELGMTALSGPIQYSDGALHNVEGCDPYPEGSLEGKIVLVDRGTCYFSDKVRNIEAAGGKIAIVANNVDGAPFPGGFGEGEYPNIPGFMIGLKDADAVKHLILSHQLDGEDSTTTMTIDPDKFGVSEGMTTGSSARGPDLSYTSIKPEIGAPGANVAAVYGTGTGEEAFGGTSGSSPVLAGAAALLKQYCTDCSPLALKALLMNNAFRGIISDTTGELAEITRIGAGELRVDQALTSTYFAYSPDDDQPSFSLGLLDVTEDVTIHRKIRIVSLLQEDQILEIKPTFRQSEKADKMSIEVMDGEHASPYVVLGACGDVVLDIVFHINADAVEANYMNSGSQGGDPETLSANEIDGYILISNIDQNHSDQEDHDDIGLPWHTLARKVAKVIPSSTVLNTGYPEVIDVVNEGAGIAQIDVFDLMALSDEMEKGPRGGEIPTPDIRAVGFRSLLVPEDECTSGFVFEFAINTWDRQAHLIPVTHYIFLDFDGDGYDDFVIWNGASDTKPSAVTTVTDLETMEGSSMFFTEHATNTGNTVFRACGEQLNLDLEEDILLSNSTMEIRVTVEAFDYFYEGPSDELAEFTIVPFGERYKDNPDIGLWTSGGDDSGGLDIAPGEIGQIDIYDMGPLPLSSSSSLGALILTNSNRGEGARGASTKDTEAIILLGSGVEGPMALPANKTQSEPLDLYTDDADLGTVCRDAVLTASPSKQPSHRPSSSPSISPHPTVSSPPSNRPTSTPTWSPTSEPTLEPTSTTQSPTWWGKFLEP